MTYYFTDLRTDDHETRKFKTLRGAVNYGCRLFRTSGYLHANEHVGSFPVFKHIVACWKDGQTRIGIVWT